MADKKTTELPENTSLNNNDKIYHVSAGGVSKFMRLSTLVNFILALVPPSTGGAEEKYLGRIETSDIPTTGELGEYFQNSDTGTYWKWTPDDSEDPTGPGSFQDTGDLIESIEFDIYPILGSVNAVTSDGIFQALSAKANAEHSHSTSEAWLSDIINLLVSKTGFIDQLVAKIEQGTGIVLSTTLEGKLRISRSGAEEGGSGDWGSIGGDIILQLDLMAEFAKYQKSPVWTEVEPVDGVVTLPAVNGSADYYEYTESGTASLVHTGTFKDAGYKWVRVTLGSSSHTITLGAGYTDKEGVAQTEIVLTGTAGRVKEFHLVRKGSSWIVYEDAGSGNGGEGTTDYEDLDNKPTINGVELTGETDPTELISQDIGRTWSSTLLFNKKEISLDAHTMSADINFTLSGSAHLSNTISIIEGIIIADGVHKLNFGSGFDFLYGIINGEVVEAGTYEIFFKYLNGVVSVSFPGNSLESSDISQLIAPAGFNAAASGANQINLSWSDVSGESGYTIESSDNGTSGWTLLTSPVAGATSYNHTGLDPNTTKHYRIKALGDGVTFNDSPYSTASAVTTASGDVTAPVVTFSPTSGATDYSVNKVITISFNEAIRNTDASQITDANVASLITLKQTNSSGSNISFTATINAGKTLITITPTSGYGINQLVYCALAPIEDGAGNHSTTQTMTFTTGEWTLFNGTSNLLRHGDVLDNIFAQVDGYFELEITIKDFLQTAGVINCLITKLTDTDNQRAFLWTFTNTDITFGFYFTGISTSLRSVRWDGVLSPGTKKLVIKYDGSIDTNNGLDRCTLEIDDVVQSGKVLAATNGTLGNIFNGTAQLAFGNAVNSFGTRVFANSFFSGLAKGMKVRSSGGIVQLDVPILYSGDDISSNNNNGTFV